MRFASRVLHAQQSPDPVTGAVNVPIYLSTTFAQDAPGKDRGYVYGRTSNPTRKVWEALLADLEGGSRGIALSSGLGALTTTMALLSSGDRIVAGDDLYGGTYRLFELYRRNFGLRVDYVRTSDENAVRNALDSAPTRMLYLETPTNPLLQLCDIRRLAQLGHHSRALVVVDNTFATPALQRPIELGADLVLHSVTKYLSGHSDVIAGALVARRPELGEALAALQNALGAVPSPMDTYLVLRGVRTLAVRMRAHSESALAVARELEGRRGVKVVHYPGLRSHPQFALAGRQMSAPGGMLSFELRAGRSAATRFLRRLKLFILAESLGAVESLAEHPGIMTHSSMPRAVREAHGITDGLIRLSCGIEDPADLVEDVRQALRGL